MTWLARLPGLLLCIAVATVAYLLGRMVPLVGGPVFGIVIGMIIGTLIAFVRRPGGILVPGIKFSAKELLQVSIVLLGLNLQLDEVARSGLHSLPVMLGTLVIILVAAPILGKALGIERNMRRLLGIGTAICGGSAIAALSTVIEVDESEIAYSIATIFLFNILAVLTFPWIGHVLDLSQRAFGLWAGTAINDTSSVVAAGYVYGHVSGNEAVVVKLTRTTLIIPIVLYYAAKRIYAARATSRQRVDVAKVMPWFILWFLAAVTVNTLGWIPSDAHPLVSVLAFFTIIIALSGVGLGANSQAMRKAGPRPLALGFLLWVLIAVSSLVIAHVARIV